MTLADQSPPPPIQRPEPVRLPVLPIVLLLLLVAGAVVGVMLLLRPRVEFINALAAPVRVVVGDGTPLTVAPGASVRIPVSRRGTTVAQWEMERPLSADGKPMGEEVRGSSVIRDPSRASRIQATSGASGAAYFAPLITNASNRPLRVLVNAGLQGAVDCGCAVRPGARRVFIGYYRLFQNSTVQARPVGSGAKPAAAMFRDLGPQVTASDGSVGLRFEDKDLR